MTRRPPSGRRDAATSVEKDGNMLQKRGPSETPRQKALLAGRDDKIRYSYVMEWHFNYTNGRTKC